MVKGKVTVRLGEVLVAVMILTAAAATAGCGILTQDRERVSVLDYTVVEPEEIPDSLLEQIAQKKEESFQFTFEDGRYLYIAEGYGKQKSGGYSIQIEDCYVSSNTIYFETELLGPQKGEIIQDTETCPYVVVKTELREEPVVFR